MNTEPEAASREEVEQAVKVWRETRALRLEQEKVADETKKLETSAKDFIISAMIAQKWEGIVIGDRLTKVSTKTVPTVEDRQALCDYIIENKALDLLQFRLATGALKERAEAGVVVPGIGSVDVYDLSDKKA